MTEDGPPPKRTSGMMSGFGMSSRLGFAGVPPSGGWTVAPTSSSGATFTPSWGFRVDDDARSPRSAIEFLRGVVPPARVTEAEGMDTARLVEQCDVDMVNLLAGYVLSKQRLGADRQRTLTEVEAMRSKLQVAEEEARTAKQELLESQSRVATLEGARSTLEGEVERLGLDVTQLKSSADLDRETIASLRQELEASVESRHSLVAGIPDIVKGVLGHRDVLGVLSQFNREAANYGRHLTSIKIRASHPEIVLPDIDDGAKGRLLEANTVWMAKDFAILARLAEMVDAPLEDILGILSS